MRRLPLVGNRLPSRSFLTTRDQRKHIYRWFQSRRKNYLLDHAIPWITFDATEYLQANLRQGIHVFEYGSGSSTLFWATFDAQCTSVEHDLTWYEFIRARLESTGTVDLRLIPADAPAPARSAPIDIADPEAYQSDWLGFEGITFQNYVTQIDAFPDAHFDVILIDGQARPSCIMHGYKKVKPGGMIILDNADVPYYLARTKQYLAQFTLHSFYGIAPIEGVMSQTNIYTLPS